MEVYKYYLFVLVLLIRSKIIYNENRIELKARTNVIYKSIEKALASNGVNLYLKIIISIHKNIFLWIEIYF